MSLQQKCYKEKKIRKVHFSKRKKERTDRSLQVLRCICKVYSWIQCTLLFVNIATSLWHDALNMTLFVNELKYQIT